MTTLTRLGDVELSVRSRHMLEMAGRGVQGPPAWRRRKLAEAQQLLALAQVAGGRRMDVILMDLQEDLRAVVRLTVPVPLEPGPDGWPVVADEAILGITYQRAALTMPMPGFAFATLLQPARAHHPNIGRARGQRLCLGAQLPAGIPVTELILLAYGLLCLQLVTLDPADREGVMNPDAAAYWQARTAKIPLSSDPFIVPGGEGAT